MQDSYYYKPYNSLAGGVLLYKDHWSNAFYLLNYLMNQVGHRVIISVTATVTQWSLLEKPFQENLRPSLRRLVYSVITCILHCYCYQDDCSTIACKLLYDSIIQRVNNEYRTTCISKADFAGEPHKHKQTSLNGWEYLCGSHSHELCATNARWRHYCSVCTILRQVLSLAIQIASILGTGEKGKTNACAILEYKFGQIWDGRAYYWTKWCDARQSRL